jgi:hypothetical protein
MDNNQLKVSGKIITQKHLEFLLHFWHQWEGFSHET